MKILALDSCGSSCGVAVAADGVVLARAEERMLRGQDGRLMPMIVETMKKSGLDFAGLDRVAVTRGPGSFTGVRVGLAAARGIGFASKKPVVGLDRFSIYRSLRASMSQNILVVIDSKRAELFCKFYPLNAAPHDACMMTEEQILAFLKDHPVPERVGDRDTPNEDILSACIDLAAQADLQDPDFLPRPLYIRAPDVTFPKTKS